MEAGIKETWKWSVSSLELFLANAFLLLEQVSYSKEMLLCSLLTNKYEMAQDQSMVPRCTGCTFTGLSSSAPGVEASQPTPEQLYHCCELLCLLPVQLYSHLTSQLFLEVLCALTTRGKAQNTDLFSVLSQPSPQEWLGDKWSHPVPASSQTVYLSSRASPGKLSTQSHSCSQTRIN